MTPTQEHFHDAKVDVPLAEFSKFIPTINGNYAHSSNRGTRGIRRSGSKRGMDPHLLNGRFVLSGIIGRIHKFIAPGGNASLVLRAFAVLYVVVQLYLVFTWHIHASKENFPAASHPPTYVVRIYPRLTGLFPAFPLDRQYTRKELSEIIAKPKVHSEGQESWTDVEQLTSKDYRENTRDSIGKGDCVPMHKWQTSFYPNCNSIHEMGTTPTKNHFAYINSGGSRTAWKVTESDSPLSETSTFPLVLKTMRAKKGFHDFLYEEQRRDAVVMERATSSPYVVDIYGLCGMSVLTEYSQGGNIHDLVKAHRLGFTDLSPLDRLRVGYQLAQAVAALHTFDGPDRPSFVHHDICCHQFLLFNGTYKANDFNYGKFLTVNATSNEICKGQLGMSLYKMRAPEEMKAKNDGSEFVLDKVDVYMLGNILYYLVTDQYLFEGTPRETAKEQIIRGDRSPFPSNMAEPALIALKKTIEMSWIHDASKRASASQMADLLLSELEHLDKNYQKGHIVRANIPPLNKKQRLTDNDWYVQN